MELKVKSIKADAVKSVYSGRDGACCCGCAGKHTYASKATPPSYGVVNDKVVRLIVGKINRAPERVYEGNHVFAVVGKRVYIAYFD